MNNKQQNKGSGFSNIERTLWIELSLYTGGGRKISKAKWKMGRRYGLLVKVEG